MLKTDREVWKQLSVDKVTTDGYVDVPSYVNGIESIKLYYKEFGDVQSQNSPLIFLHGGPGVVDHQIYTPFWSQLAETIRVIFFDMRGHGNSGGHGKEYEKTWTFGHWGKDVYEFCKARNINKPIVVGFSFGGWVAMDYVIQFPKHPGKLVLCNTEAKVLVEERAKAYEMRALERGYDAEKAKAVGQVVRDLRDKRSDSETSKRYIEECMPLFSNNPYTEEELSWCSKPNQAVWESFDKNLYYTLDYRGKLGGTVTCPTLCIGGSKDPEHPPAGISAVADELSYCAELSILENAGDPVWRDAKDQVLSVLKTFIRR